MLLGLWSGMQTGVIVGDQPYGLPLTEKLMPQHLNPLGYRSHIVGKVRKSRKNDTSFTSFSILYSTFLCLQSRLTAWCYLWRSALWASSSGEVDATVFSTTGLPFTYCGEGEISLKYYIFCKLVLWPVYSVQFNLTQNLAY